MVTAAVPIPSVPGVSLGEFPDPPVPLTIAALLVSFPVFASTVKSPESPPPVIANVPRLSIL